MNVRTYAGQSQGYIMGVGGATYGSVLFSQDGTLNNSEGLVYTSVYGDHHFKGYWDSGSGAAIQPIMIMKGDNGNVGIGTSAPDTLLHLNSDSGLRLRLSGDGTFLDLYKVDGAERIVMESDSGAEIMTWDGANSKVGIGTTGPEHSFHVKLDNNAGVGHFVAKFEHAWDSGQIDTTDGVCVMQFSGDADVTGATFIQFADTAEIGSVRADGTGASVAYNTTSDYRLKENEVSISDGLTRVNQLKPYRFNFKKNKAVTVDGFFAHEVQSIVPHAVSGAKDAIKQDGSINPQQIDHSKIVPLLVSAIQELDAKIPDASGTVKVIEKTKVEVVDSPVYMSDSDNPPDWHAIAMALDLRLKAVESELKK